MNKNMYIPLAMQVATTRQKEACANKEMSTKLSTFRKEYLSGAVEKRSSSSAGRRAPSQ